MRKKKDVTLYDGGFLVLIVIVAIVFLIGVVKENLKKDPHFYDYKPTNINWGQLFTQTQSTQSYISPDYSTQQEENEPSYFEKWQQEREQEEAYKKAHTKVRKYNPRTGEHEYVYPDQVQKYNPWTGEYEWAYPNERPHYNWRTGEHEY